MILTNKQRKFLEYLKKEHDCMGYLSTVNTILQTGKYNTCAADNRINFVVSAFRNFRDAPDTKVTKYFKG